MKMDYEVEEHFAEDRAEGQKVNAEVEVQHRTELIETSHLNTGWIGASSAVSPPWRRQRQRQLR